MSLRLPNIFLIKPKAPRFFIYNLTEETRVQALELSRGKSGHHHNYSPMILRTVVKPKKDTMIQ